MRRRLGRLGRAAMPARWLIVGLIAAGPAVADDTSVGRAKAQACAVCHGPVGVAIAPDAPNLAGQPAAYLATQLKAFRDGTRKHEVMTLMAKGLSDPDIAAIAGWFSSIRIEAQPPP